MPPTHHKAQASAGGQLRPGHLKSSRTRGLIGGPLTTQGRESASHCAVVPLRATWKRARRESDSRPPACTAAAASDACRLKWGSG